MRTANIRIWIVCVTKKAEHFELIGFRRKHRTAILLDK